MSYDEQGYDPATAAAASYEQTAYSALDHFELEEERNGVRFSWNEWPSTKLSAERAVVPIGCLYTPLRPIPHLPVVQYEPLRCHNANCGAVLNPSCSVDLRSKLWACPFCLTRNHFPPHYAENITETNLPAELMPDYTTIEYELQHHHTHKPPVFFFLVDLAVSEEELDEMKDSLQQMITILPDDAIVGMISFGTMVQLHELGPAAAEVPRAYVFRGSRDIPADKLSHLLQLSPEMNPRFLLPVSDCAIQLDAVIEDLRPDPWPVKSDHRAARCTGVALSVAVGLLEKVCSRQGARVMLFAGGPPSVGPGCVCSTELSAALRSHTDIQKGRAALLKPAKQFYETLAARCVTNCHAVDIFASSLDQVGLLEMRSLTELTGGVCVLADSFGQSVFKESLRRVFTRNEDDVLAMGLAATIEIVTSKEYKVRGCLGGCCSLNKKSPNVSENPLGQGGTYAWRVGALGVESTLAFYFEVSQEKTTQQQQQHSRRHLQFVTQYQHPTGTTRMRVTTVSGLWQQDVNNLTSILPSFDQEAAATLIARVATHRAETEETTDVLRWLDRALIRLCSKFGSYRAEDASSFSLPSELNIYPQFMFHLRRSPFLQVFNSSPDEACYRKMLLNNQCVRNSLLMVQPALLSYSFHGPPEPALLDVTSIQSNTILLLDTFFHVVVFHGETIASWRDQGYQDQPEHENFRQLLQAPRDDAQQLMLNRFPVPRYIVCDQHKSQSRFILAKLNPSVGGGASVGGAQQVFTDDVSLSVFMESLMKLAVQK